MRNLSSKQAKLLEQTLQQLRQTQAKLIHGEKMASLGQTVAGIAHEINNPVNFIHGNLNPTQQAFQDLLALIHLFQETYPQSSPAIAVAIEEIDLEFLAEDVPNMLMSMKAGTERIRDIVKSLRVFSRLDEADIKVVDIHQGIDSALLILQSKLNSQTAATPVSIIKDYGVLPSLKCHASQLNQVFVNLLSNAIDAVTGHAPSPEIQIHTASEADGILITISDNGVGIPAEIRSKIFDPFFTTKPVGKGTGLGLSICHQIIVDTHQGSLDCWSEEGQGTQFVIKLPLWRR